MTTLHEHAVQFFDSHQTAAAALAAFVRAGLANDERIVLITRLDDWNRAAVHLSRDVPLSDTIASGQLTVCDSARTLEALLVDGWPSAERFEQVVATMIAGDERAAAGLRAYGDMVDLLASDGRCDAAARLEELWNDLRGRVPFTLFCGYSSSHFCNVESGEALQRIRRLHSHERCASGDFVAAHLLVQRSAQSR